MKSENCGSWLTSRSTTGSSWGPMTVPHLSIVSPVFQAEACVPELCRRLKQALAPITENFEIILIEDRSPDNSWAAIQAEATQDPRVRGIRLARNSGQHVAITAGLDFAEGDWVVVMDCDLQDSPEDIPHLYATAIQGYEIVIAQFYERTESTFRQGVSRAFWSGLSWLAGITFDHRSGNFRIMSSRVVKNFRNYREQLRFLGGITALMGFTTTTLKLTRKERYTGRSSYTLQKLFSIAIDIAMAYSDKPLKLSVFVGFIISALALVVGGTILILGINGKVEVPGWASVMVSLYFLSGLIIANLGLIGYYIGKIFDESKRRPLYNIEKTTYDILANTQSHLRGVASGGSVIWITGLSGSGKSTLASELAARLRAEKRLTILLDGDELRKVLNAVSSTESNHGREARLSLAKRYALLCQLLAAQGFTVIIATISLFHEVHAWNRANLPGYFEIYLKVPVEELRRRDPKGIYRRFDAGELTHVAGLDLPIDEPSSPDWVVEFEPSRPLAVVVDELMQRLEKRGS